MAQRTFLWESAGDYEKPPRYRQRQKNHLFYTIDIDIAEDTSIFVPEAVDDSHATQRNAVQDVSNETTMTTEFIRAYLSREFHRLTVEIDRTLRMRELEAGEKHTQCYYKKQNSNDERQYQWPLVNWLATLPGLQE